MRKGGAAKLTKKNPSRKTRGCLHLPLVPLIVVPLPLAFVLVCRPLALSLPHLIVPLSPRLVIPLSCHLVFPLFVLVPVLVHRPLVLWPPRLVIPLSPRLVIPSSPCLVFPLSPLSSLLPPGLSSCCRPVVHSMAILSFALPPVVPSLPLLIVKICT